MADALRVRLRLLALCAAPPAHAQLQIEITKGVTDPIPIAVVPFSRAVPADGGLDVSSVVLARPDEQRALPDHAAQRR